MIHRLVLAAVLGICSGLAGDLFAQADQRPRLSFRVLGDPLPNQWQATASHVEGHTLIVHGTELERPGHTLGGWLEAHDSSLWVELCDDAELRHGAPAAAPTESVGLKWRRVGYEFSIAPLRSGRYTLTIATCSLEGESVIVFAEPYQIAVP
jgi:hypothetical protein